MAEREFLKSSLRVFLSVDIVGSTAIKQAASGKVSLSDRDNWQGVIVNFFSDFDSRLRHEWESSIKNLGDDFEHLDGSTPIFWKGLGDEALYYVDLKSFDEALFCVASFLKTVNAVRRTIKSKDSRLDLKAAAWLAGFPVNNFEFVVGASIERPHPNHPVWDDDWVSTLNTRLDIANGVIRDGEVDFVGPQIDLGFRLAAHATPRKMVVSVDLAWLLITAYNRSKDKWTGRFDLTKSFYLEERISLKGVLSGTPYPLVWIDILPEEGFHEAEFTALKKEPAHANALEEYCKQFISSMSDKHCWMILPFIKKEDGSLIGTEPEHQQDTLAQWQQRWDDACAALEDEGKTYESEAKESNPDEISELKDALVSWALTKL